MQLSDEEKFQLVVARDRAKRVIDFLESRFWTEDFGPFLKGQSERKTMPPFDPNIDTQDCENIALRYSFNSGKLKMCDLIRQELALWQKKGEEAAERLRRLSDIEEREQRLKQPV